MLPNVMTKQDAPDASERIISEKKDGFCVIMELTKEEKRELLAMWRLKNGKKS